MRGAGKQPREVWQGPSTQPVPGEFRMLAVIMGLLLPISKAGHGSPTLIMMAAFLFRCRRIEIMRRCQTPDSPKANAKAIFNTRFRCGRAPTNCTFTLLKRAEPQGRTVRICSAF